jgi:hypothetical protein
MGRGGEVFVSDRKHGVIVRFAGFRRSKRLTAGVVIKLKRGLVLAPFCSFYLHVSAGRGSAHRLLLGPPGTRTGSDLHVGIDVGVMDTLSDTDADNDTNVEAVFSIG